MLAFLKSFRFAWQGIKYAWRGRNFRVQCASAFAVFFLGMYFNIRPTEWLAIIIISSFVLAFEIVNTAIEHLVDFVSPQYHPLAGKIKDLAAGAVLLLSIASFIIGILIFWPYLFDKIQSI